MTLRDAMFSSDMTIFVKNLWETLHTSFCPKGMQTFAVSCKKQKLYFLGIGK